MVDVTNELQQMADDAASQARPLAAAEVIRRGDRRHRRSITRLSLGGLFATGVVAAVIIGVTALPPASRQASHSAHAQLAAWTVTEHGDGTILIKIREFRDPAGLQSKLRADGVPISIIFIPAGGIPTNPDRIPGNPCRQFNGGHWPESWLLRAAYLADPQAPDPFQAGVIIHPSALPNGAGLQFYIGTNLGPQHDGGTGFFEDLVQASPQCTGS